MRTTIDCTDYFAPGDNWFLIDLVAYANPSSFADFANASTISGSTLNTPGYTLELPEGLYVQDPARAGRFLLASLVPTPVPEPGTYALMLAGLAAAGWRRRARAGSSHPA